MRLNPTYFGSGELVRLRGGRCQRASTFGGSPAALQAARRSSGRAFTLLELLVVMAIIAILATVGIPSLKGLGGNLDIDSANRQLLDDLAYARLKAINERTRVYVVFVPPSIVQANWNNLPPDQMKVLTNLVGRQYRSYALFTERSLGDQPGRRNPSYLTEWRTLPNGTFIAPHKFQHGLTESQRLAIPLTNRPFAYFPVNFPTEYSPRPDSKVVADQIKYMPCVVFDYQGRLVSPNGNIVTDEYIPLSKGSIVYPMDANKNLTMEPAEVIETPPTNHIHNPAIRVDWLTGRSRAILPRENKTK